MGGGDATLPVPWDRLRAWIDQTEAAEEARRQNNQPGSALSLQQLQAISMLINIWDDDEPEMDGGDHVSALMMLIQKRGYKQPVFQDLDPVDIPAGGVTVKRWRVVCRIASASQFPDGFPALGYGIDDAAKGVPLFKSKKLAKQYAALHARAFLMNVPPSLPKNAKNVKNEPAQQQKQQQQQQGTRTRTSGDVIREREARLGGISGPSQAGRASRGSDYGGSVSGGGDDGDDDLDGGQNYEPAGHGYGSRYGYGYGPRYGSPPAAASPRLSGDFASDDGPSVVARVAQLAGALGLESPRYDVVEDGTPGWYTGAGVFQGVPPMPAECTVVRNVLGKTKAKEEVAKQMLRWLEAEEKIRGRHLEEMTMDPVKQEAD
ncbi:hypothetical protein ESCO_006058 [Escovopsis weberi]|uniref:DRBM domain-containing protein n=1 Tax=Escovopsis weberi TaxID=150374 RepID=A0A0M8MUD6_ESCWE|nr:hypothetical protein ESCO_006058 [Escovopsis weberi]